MNMWKNITNRRASFIFLAVSVAVSISAFVYCFYNGLILLYADSYFHLNIARRVVDGITPGFVQLGTVWLPLPHISMLPFVWNDFLWRTGIAGSIPSMIAFVLSSYFLFRILNILTGDLFISFLGGVLFVLNPNVLYLQSIPMTEIWFISAMLGSVYFLIKWFKESRESNKIKWLVISSGFAFFGMFTRYEGWFLILVEVLVILYVHTVIYRDKEQRSLGRIEGDVLVFLSPAILGVIIWLFYNWTIWGNPLEFLSGRYSAYHQQLEFLQQGKLFTKGEFLLSIKSVMWAVFDNAGYVLIASLVFFSFVLLPVYLIIKRLFRGDVVNHISDSYWAVFALILLFSPCVFQIYSLYQGNTILYVHELFPEQPMFNIRYGVLIFPGLVVALGVTLSLLKNVKFILIPIAVLQVSLFLMNYQSIVSFDDGKHGMSSANKSADAEECWLYLSETRSNNELVLASSLVNDIYIPTYNIQFKDIIHEGSYQYWQQSLSDPARYATWILMQEDDFDPLYQLKDAPFLNEEFYKDKDCNGWSVWHVK